MLMRLSHDLGLYLYDIVVARFDVWAAFGVIAQLVFGARFLVQWIASEKAERSVIPVGFWFLSISGGLMTLIYGFARRDLVIILGQLFSIFIYVRNLMLISKEAKTKAEARAKAIAEAETEAETAAG
ncbi:lipid-A-disaccharide synthase N-terminal domain-containing protein [Microvirga puerhi]|uniref:Lipid-A-disaccharide synthase N-terminal domain-containing protein n=1 Tax=Microvirga puerhi TaxID=2876078 RepID=A0ABS7VNU5_9HYPH|nr:lipid-A-disaccharide synthase N-terminal domain-containing protein [Microvirga puerhi]MBZ6076816.1 lipid-A-disaccharide synthase N-terminal domain-containing protein [Microvirga puerhi]